MSILNRTMRRVVLNMPNEMAELLTKYSKLKGKTISNVAIELLKANIHKQAYVCTAIKDLLDELEISLDKRAAKRCYGYACWSCKHDAKCRAGLHDNDYEVKPECADSLKPGAEI